MSPNPSSVMFPLYVLGHIFFSSLSCNNSIYFWIVSRIKQGKVYKVLRIVFGA